jgi:hypothetical protein
MSKIAASATWSSPILYQLTPEYYSRVFPVFFGECSQESTNCSEGRLVGWQDRLEESAISSETFEIREEVTNIPYCIYQETRIAGCRNAP